MSQLRGLRLTGQPQQATAQTDTAAKDQEDSVRAELAVPDPDLGDSCSL